MQDEQSYEKYIGKNFENLPIIGNNHHKASDVFANFGYVSVDGNWADPDSEGELFDAQMKHISIKSLPHAPPKDSSVMSPDEQDRMYERYIEDVTDEEDGEGDPRKYRISPATFLQWATGTMVGDQFVETVMETPVSFQKEALRSGSTDLL